MILHKVPILPYHLELWVLMSDDPASEISKLNVTNPGINIIWHKDAAAITSDIVWNNIITCIFDRKCFDASIAAHEAVHVVNMVFMFSDIKHDPNNDEPQAYLTGWVVGEIHKANKKKK